MLAAMQRVDIKGMAHITGGGLLENVHRMFPDDVAARIESSRWPQPRSSNGCRARAKSPTRRCIACSTAAIGMVVVVAAVDAARANALLAEAGETVYEIGAVVSRDAGAPGTVVV
jgi:phosphoribosylformylglycinamidine cyclo-ligase